MIRELLRPWRERQTWRDLVHLVLDGFVGTATFPVVFTGLVVSGALLLIPFLWPFAAVGLWCLFLCGRIIGHVERSRYAALLGVDLADPVPPLEPSVVFDGLIAFQVWA